ncbi:hypothetical protein CHRYSEOSP005_14860 [Chryseobacterium sp. Alg-005]|uniref:hypothetical protein n=1 Tax=Chryseobacterium sp. Alg-005 TaxID=3159516 RepID=UPI003555B8BC
MIKLPFLNKEFASKEETVKFLKENRKRLIDLKKSKDHETPTVKFQYSFEYQKTVTNKAEEEEIVSPQDADTIKVKVVMNTTNYLDSHFDVHLPGIWKKTIEQNAAKGFYHIQEHQTSKFDYIIAYPEDVKVYTEFKNWSELGYSFPGQTECLIFESIIRKDVNPLMFERYKKKRVREHSVGMRYMQIELAVYDPEDEKEMDFWNKYIGQIVNREVAEEYGFFWVVPEAKLREGSAVPFGSNDTTPTLEVEEKENTEDSDKSISNEPSPDIQQEPQTTQKFPPSSLLIY